MCAIEPMRSVIEYKLYFQLVELILSRRKVIMKLQSIIGVLLLVLGFIGLAYGGFTYTKDTHKADIGSLHLSVEEKKHVNIPASLGLGLLVIGGLLLLIPRKN